MANIPSISVKRHGTAAQTNRSRKRVMWLARFTCAHVFVVLLSGHTSLVRSMLLLFNSLFSTYAQTAHACSEYIQIGFNCAAFILNAVVPLVASSHRSNFTHFFPEKFQNFFDAIINNIERSPSYSSFSFSFFIGFLLNTHIFCVCSFAASSTRMILCSASWKISKNTFTSHHFESETPP